MEKFSPKTFKKSFELVSVLIDTLEDRIIF